MRNGLYVLDYGHGMEKLSAIDLAEELLGN